MENKKDTKRHATIFHFHRENGGTLGMVPLIINPIYTLCRAFVLGISPFKGLLGGVKQQGYHPKGTRHFPLTFVTWVFPKIFSTPKWMVKIMENPIKLLDWMIWGYPYFRKHPHKDMFHGDL